MQALSPCSCRDLVAARPAVQGRPQRLVCRAAVPGGLTRLSSTSCVRTYDDTGCPETQQATLIAEKQQQQQRQQLTSLPLLVAGLAAAGLIGASGAEAKVKFQQPDKPVRQLFQRDPNAPQPPKVENPVKGDGGGFKLPFSAPSFSAPSLPGLPNLPAGPKEVAGGIDARTIALPGAVIGIAGLGFALTKLDPGFSKVLYETVIKDSNSSAAGAGYEEVLKGGADQIGKTLSRGSGTKRIKPKKGQKPGQAGKGKGGSNIFAGLLGKK